jgi:hypothetical protein
LPAAGHAGGELGVGVQRLLGLGDDLAGLAGVGRQHALDLADVAQAAVGLGLEEEHRVDDGLGLGRGQLVDQLGMDVARPRPAADVAHALVIDGDDRDLVRGLARARRAGEVVVTPVERADEVGGVVKDQHRQDHQDTHEPVRAPELHAFGG